MNGCARTLSLKDKVPTKEQQLDVLGCLDAILLEVLFDLLAALDGSALLGRRRAAHGNSAHGLTRYARQRRAPGMLAGRRRAQPSSRTRSRRARVPLDHPTRPAQTHRTTRVSDQPLILALAGPDTCAPR